MMNLTQRVIVLVGNPIYRREALKTLRGFKAVTEVETLSEEIMENIFMHNKNVLVEMNQSNSLILRNYDPVIVKIINGKSNLPLMELGTANIINDFPRLMDELGIDVGDHISHDSAGKRENKLDCMVCRIVKGNPYRKEHILYASENFFVVPGLGAFFDGYIMICPKRHIMSFAECSPEEFDEFLQVLDDMKLVLKAIYKKDVFVFENGSGCDGGGKHNTSIVHAHIHLAPTDMPVLKYVKKSGIHPAFLSNPEKLITSYGKYPYKLFIDQFERWFIASDPDTYYPRQLQRQILADYMGLPKGAYNWRKFGHDEKLEQIATEITSFLSRNFDNLPPWMQENLKNYLW